MMIRFQRAAAGPIPIRRFRRSVALLWTWTSKHFAGGFVAFVSFPFLLRGAISCFHPKEGEILSVVSLGGSVDFPGPTGYRFITTSYDVLTSIWQSGLAFYGLWLLWTGAALTAHHVLTNEE